MGLSGNQLLDSLVREYPKASSWIDFRTHPSGLTLYPEGNRAREVYFPITGMVGLLIRMQDGEAGGLIPVGREGFAGVGALLETDSNVHSIVQQLSGRVACLPADAFRQAVEANPKLRRMTRRYVVFLLRFFQQALACERSHTLRERTSLWLLRMNTWMEGEPFTLTQDSLAMMVGVRRQSVSEIAKDLQDTGCIAYNRAQVRILDAERLAQAACNCYTTLNLAYDRLLPADRSLGLSVR